MKRSVSLTRNVSTNWATLVMSSVYTLLITPVVVHALGNDGYGVWSNLNGLLAYSELFYMGLGGAIIRFVAEARAKGDLARISRLTSTVLSIYSVIGILCFLIFVVLSDHVERLFEGGLRGDIAGPAVFACVLIGARVFLVFIGSAFSGLLAGHDRFDLVNTVFMGSAAVRLVAIPFFVRSASEPMMTLAVLMTLTTLVENLVLVAIAYWYVPDLTVRIVRPTRGELRLLYGFGFQAFLVLTAFKLISSTDLFVISKKLGEDMTALYSPALMLVEYARMSVAAFSGVLLPRLTLLRTTADHASMRETYLSAARIGCFIAGWAGAGVIALGPAFLTIWLGPEFGAAARPVLIWLALSAFASALSTQIPYPFYQAFGVMMLPAGVLFLEGLINVSLSVWLAPQYGIAGVAFATAVPALLLTPLILPPMLCRRLGVSLTSLVVQGVLPGVAMLVSSLLVLGVASTLITSLSYPSLILQAALTLPIALVVMQLTFPLADRQQIRRALRLPVR